MLGRGPCGVYAITSKKSGNSYVGSSKHVYLRWAQHNWELAKGLHRNKSLQAAWNKHSKEGFEYILLEICECEVLWQREQYYIDNHNSVYNATKIAGGPDAEMRSRASERMRVMNKLPWSEERWNNFRNGVKNKRPHPPITTSTKQKMSASARARKERERQEGRPSPAHVGAVRKLTQTFGKSYRSVLLDLIASGMSKAEIGRKYRVSSGLVETGLRHQ